MQIKRLVFLLKQSFSSLAKNLLFRIRTIMRLLNQHYIQNLADKIPTTVLLL